MQTSIPKTVRKTPRRSAKPAGKATRQSLAKEVQSALEWLKDHATNATLDGMARYAIPSDHALGVPMKDVKALGKQLGPNQELAVALWDTGVYEARMLASFVGDPAQITAAQMDRWCRQFDNWAFCDAMCFNLFDRSVPPMSIQETLLCSLTRLVFCTWSTPKRRRIFLPALSIVNLQIAGWRLILASSMQWTSSAWPGRSVQVAELSMSGSGCRHEREVNWTGPATPSF